MSEIERESMEFDVVIVGAGPVGLFAVFELGQQFFLSPFTKVSHQFVIKVEMVLNRGLAFACDEKDLPYVIGFQFLDHILDHRLFSHRKHFFGL